MAAHLRSDCKKNTAWKYKEIAEALAALQKEERYDDMTNVYSKILQQDVEPYLIGMERDNGSQS